MADKKYKLKFHLSNGTVIEVEFVAPQGPQGDPFTYADFTQEQLAALKGLDGKSAYEYAQEAGFEGSEEEFAQKLAALKGAEVGDILTTVRTDLGEKWLLCNGEQVSANDYSELAAIVPPCTPELWNLMDVGEIGTSAISAACGNGYCVVCSSKAIAYTTDPAGTWTVKSVDGISSINSVTYVNGYFILCGSATGYSAVIAYAKDPAGDWTVRTVWTGNNGYSPAHCVAYGNGYWVVGGLCYKYNYSETNRAEIAYATDLDGDWTSKDLWGNSTEAAVKGIAYGNGYWAAVGSNGGSTSYSRCAYTTDLAGSWTNSTLYLYESNSITYANGYWVVTGYAYSSSMYYGSISYTTDPSRSWTRVEILAGSSAKNNQINSVVYGDGYWLVGGYSSSGAVIAYAAEPTGEWNKKVLWGSSEKSQVLCVAHGDGYWVAAGKIYEDGNYASQAAYIDPDIFILPTISTDGAYTYIKALEG